MSVVLYKGLIDGASKMVRLEGARSLYKGFSIVLLGAAPAQALFFTGMSTVQKV